MLYNQYGSLFVLEGKEIIMILKNGQVKQKRMNGYKE